MLSTATLHVIKLLKEIINRHGVPSGIISDPGSAFTSRELATELEIRHVIATAEPSPNHRDWDEWLSVAVSAINLLSSQQRRIRRFSLSMDVRHNIDTGNSRPITSRPYRISQFERSTISEKVNKMIKSVVIQPSNSTWSSPLVLVKKRNSGPSFTRT